MKETITIRAIGPEEIDIVAGKVATGYYNDIFFRWTVPDDEKRHAIVKEYYSVYLRAAGCVAHVAQAETGEIVGATVWLPHDVDMGIYDDIDQVAGIYASHFRAVADWSHYSEPPMAPFYQLVGFAVEKQMQGMGIGHALLKHQLDALDALGIPTYLEASTPYKGKGVYGKFGYQPVGELMVFDEHAILYPLWRPAAAKKQVSFARHIWRVLEERPQAMLLLREEVMEFGAYHDSYTAVTWAQSDLRRRLNGDFLASFSSEEQAQILPTEIITHPNPRFHTPGGERVVDKVFVLSVQEVLRYFGNSLQAESPGDKYFIDDQYNAQRMANGQAGKACRWLLRTPGSSPAFISLVTKEGKICLSGDFSNRASTPLFSVGVRPAIWVGKGSVE